MKSLMVLLIACLFITCSYDASNISMSSKKYSSGLSKRSTKDKMISSSEIRISESLIYGSGAAIGAASERELIPMVDDVSPSAGIEMNPMVIMGDDDSWKLKPGVLSYDIPKEMVLWEKSRIILRVNDSITDNLTEDMSDNSEIISIESSVTMKAVLRGDGFVIDTLTSTTQLRKFNRPTEWKWDVIPNSSGNQKLTINVTCVLKRQGFSDDFYDSKVFEVETEVKINKGIFIKGLIERYWKSILSAIAGSGFIGGLITFIRKRRKIKS